MTADGENTLVRITICGSQKIYTHTSEKDAVPKHFRHNVFSTLLVGQRNTPEHFNLDIYPLSS